MPDDTLVEYQTKAANEVVAEYFFEVTGGGVEEPVKSATKKALKKGVKLHFFRYGFFDKKSKTDTPTTFTTVTKKEKQKITTTDIAISNDEIPAMDKFYLTRTFLRKGYIYIINKNSNNQYREYEVSEDGRLKNIIWSSGNDGNIRKAKKNETILDFITVDNTGEYYISFSPVQWGRDYFDSINTNEDKKADLMQLINCIGIEIGSTPESDEVVSYKDIKLSCDTKHPQKTNFRKRIKNIHTDEETQTETGDNEFYEDMFVTLNDPVGCAEDIAEVLSDKIIEFKALVEAIQTGHSIDKAKIELAKGKTLEPISKEYQDLYNLALTTYKMVYSSDEAIRQYDGGDIGFNFLDTHYPNQAKPKGYSSRRGRRYKYPPGYKFNEVYIGNGVDSVKVKGILGVHIRKEKRETLNALRKEYWNFIQTQYLKETLCHYLNNTPEYCLYGKEFIHRHLLLIYNNPYNYDRHLLHQKNYKETDDIITGLDGYLEKEDVVNTEDNLERIILEKIALDKSVLSEVIDVANKFAGATASKLELYSTKAFKAKIIVSASTGKPLYQKIIKQRNNYILKKINRIQVSTMAGGTPQDVYFIGGNTNKISIKADLLGLDPNVEVLITNADGTNQKFIGDTVNHKHISAKKAITKGGRNELLIGDNVQNISEYEYRKNELYGKRYSQKAANFFNSRGFNGVLFGLQVINIVNSVNGLVETLNDEKISGTQKFKSILGTAGVSVDLANAYGTLRQVHLRAINQNITRGLASRTALAGAVGGVLTSGMCFWDASVAFGKRDTDSGVAWALAGVAFGAATTAGIIGGLATASASGTLSAAGTVAVGALGGAEAVGALALITNPIGWVCLGIGTGLVVAAYLLSDNELEFYFKHFLLNDRVNWEVKKDQLPMAYTQSILSNKVTLMDTDDPEILNSLMEPADAIASLFDHTIANAITFNAPFEFKSDWHGSGRAAHRKVYGYNVSFVIKRFLNDPCQVKTRAVLIDGTSGSPEEFDIRVNNDIIKETEQGPMFAASYVIPQKIREKIGRYSKLVLAIKIHLKDNETANFFPYPLQNKKDRYMGTCIRLYEGRGPNQVAQKEQEIVFDSFNELVNKWK